MSLPNRTNGFNYTILGLTIFLLFCTLFNSYIELPPLLAWLGKWHPLLLHFPIVLLLGIALLTLFNRPVHPLLFKVTVLTTLLTAISGFFLATDITDKGDILLRHQWLGSGLAFLCVIWYAFVDSIPKKPLLKKGIPGLILVITIGTGHFGGMLTHGEDFLSIPLNKSYSKIPENPLVYNDIAARILDQNCVSCHNPNKKKGELLMTSLANLKKGGENGPALVPGNLEESELIRRIELPKEDEEHMPPEGKKALDAIEIDILRQWILKGAPDTLRLYDLAESDPLAKSIREFMAPDQSLKYKDFATVADSTLQRLASDYLTITRLYGQSNALAVDAYKPPEYQPDYLLRLQEIADNIVELDFSNLPLGNAEVGLIAKCKNLEWLEVDGTPFKDENLDFLQGLNKIRLLKIFNTEVSDKSITSFKEFENLQQLYVWNTNLSPEGIKEIREANSEVLVIDGIEETFKEFFVSKDSVPSRD